MGELDNKWHNRFMEMAHNIAGWSKDPSTQVGCVIVDTEKRIISVGYNGFPRGVDDNDERLSNRSIKYLMVQHAEANAVTNAASINAGERLKGATAYVTHYPCSNCAGLLIQAGVSTIVTLAPDGGFSERFADSFKASKAMFEETGVQVSILQFDDTETMQMRRALNEKKEREFQMSERFRIKSQCDYCGYQSMDIYPDENRPCPDYDCDGSMKAY